MNLQETRVGVNLAGPGVRVEVTTRVLGLICFDIRAGVVGGRVTSGTECGVYRDRLRENQPYASELVLSGDYALECRC